MNYRELQVKRDTLVAEARERLDQIGVNTDEGRAKELEGQHDAAMAALDALDANITRAKRVEDEERKQDEARETALRNRRPTFNATETTARSDDGEAYRAAFREVIRNGGRLEALDSEMRAQLTTSGSQGGYTVPTTMRPQIIEALKTFGPLYDDNIVFTLTTVGGAPITMPTVDDTTNVAPAHVEGQPLAADGSGDVTFGKKQLAAYSFATPWIALSKELMDDSAIAMEQFIAKLIGTRLGRTANDKLSNGSGVNEPTGIFVGAATGLTAAAKDAISGDELISLYHSVDPAYRASSKCAWLLNDSTVGVVRKVKDASGKYVWSNGDIQNDDPAKILGKPVYVNQNAPNLTAGLRPIVFGDLGQFMVRKAGEPLVGAIQDSKFYPGVGVAGFIRFDSAVLIPAAIKALVMGS